MDNMKYRDFTDAFRAHLQDCVDDGEKSIVVVNDVASIMKDFYPEIKRLKIEKEKPKTEIHTCCKDGCEEKVKGKAELCRKHCIELWLIRTYIDLSIDQPRNHDSIIEYMLNYIEDKADPVDWHSGDIAIAFKSYLESNPNFS